MQAIPRKQRAMVRKGIKAACAARSTRRRPLLRAVCRQRHRHGTPACPSDVRGAHACFGDDCEVLTVAPPDGQPLSSVMSFYFRDEVLPYYAGDEWRRATWRPTTSSTGN